MRLFYLDESGVCPSGPAGYSRPLPGDRGRVKSECPHGRRVNAPATYEPPGPAAGRHALKRALTSDDLLAYPRERRPAADVPRVVAPDEAGVHTSKAVRPARPRRSWASTRTTHRRTRPS